MSTRHPRRGGRLAEHRLDRFAIMQTQFRHEAVPLSGLAAFAGACSAAVLQALDSGERPLVLAHDAMIGEVGDALGAARSQVSFLAGDEHARNPGRVASILHSFAGHDRADRAVAVIQVSMRGRSPAALDELLLAECVLNSRHLAELALTVLCMIDVDGLDDARLLAVRRCHPHVVGVAENHDFDEALATELHATDLPDPPADAEQLVIDSRRLGVLRAFVRSIGGGHGLAPDRVDDLVLAANEAVANSLRYGGGRSTVRVWADEASVICDVRDHGYIRDPMTGRLPPPATSDSGRGLWLMHHLCDLVQLRSSETKGTTVRLFVDR